MSCRVSVHANVQKVESRWQSRGGGMERRVCNIAIKLKRRRKNRGVYEYDEFAFQSSSLSMDPWESQEEEGEKKRINSPLNERLLDNSTTQ